jgi:hypothetical protein
MQVFTRKPVNLSNFVNNIWDITAIALFTGVTIGDVVYLGCPIAPSHMRPNAGHGDWRGLRPCGVSDNEYSCARG